MPVRSDADTRVTTGLCGLSRTWLARAMGPAQRAPASGSSGGFHVVLWVSACSNVPVLHLTSEEFSPRPINDVQILEKEPTTEHLRLAEPVASSSTSSLDDLQRDIVKKAAKLGASAVVFSRPGLLRTHYIGWLGA